MKSRNLIKNIITRVAAVILLLAVCSGTMLYSLGYVNLQSSGGEDSGKSDEQSRLEDYLGSLGTGDNISDISKVPDTGTSAVSTPETSTPDTGNSNETGSGNTEVTDSPSDPSVPDKGMSFAEYLDAGYEVSWLKYSPGMAVVELKLDRDDLGKFTNGATKEVTVRIPFRYDGGYREIEKWEKRTEERRTVELYMGYIIVDSGIGTAVAITLPTPEGSSETTSGTSEETTEPQRQTFKKVPTVTIYNSYGKLLGTYPAADVVPAYTRDTSDRALFVHDGKYYYINEENGVFELSDYNPDTDGRGLYFDYAPNFGKSDCDLKIFSTVQPITLTYSIDSSSYYARYGVDYRIARELYEAYPTFAEQVAVEYRPGVFYNRLFKDALERAIKEIEAEKKAEATATTEEKDTGETEPLPTPPDTLPETVPGTVTGTDTDAAGTTGVGTDPVIQPTDQSGDLPTGSTASPETEPETPSVTESVEDPSMVVPADADADVSVDVGVLVAENESVSDSSTSDAATDQATDNVTTDTVTDSTTESVIGSDTPPVPDNTVDTNNTDTSTSPIPSDTTSDITNAPVTEPEPETSASVGSTLVVSKVFDAYRFAYGKKQPAVNTEKTTVNSGVYTSYIMQTISWATEYKYAKAFNFNGGRAVTVDDNGIIRVINTSGRSVIYLNRTYKTDASRGGQYATEFYVEPFERDVYQLGYYYFDGGLMRLRRCERLSYNINVYNADDDILVDTYGNRYHVPDGYTLVSYSERILLLERDGRYGYYHADGYWVAQPIYTYAAPFVEGLGVIGFSDGVRGVIDTSGNIVIPFAYTEITNASSGIIACYSEETGWKMYAKMSK